MADSDYVDVEISLAAAATAVAGFGIALIPSYTASWPERTRTYSSAAGILADFANANLPENRIAAALFAQPTPPTPVVVGRFALKPTKILSISAINPTTTASHTYSLRVRCDTSSSVDTTVTFTSDSSPTDAEWAAAAVTALNAVANKNYTAAGSSSPVTITGSAAGDWFSVEVDDPTVMKISETTADAGIATDLAAIFNENKTWYAFGNTFNSAAVADAAAVWIEANKRLFIVQSQDTSTILTAAGNGDAIDTLKTNNYGRSAGFYHPHPSEFGDFAWMGTMLPLMKRGLGIWPTWAIKPLAAVSVVPLTETQRANIVARNATSFELVYGVNRTMNTAQVGSGEYIDTTIGIDAIRNDGNASVFDLLDQNGQVPYTDPGISGVGAKIRATLKRAESDQILVAGSSSVTTPKLANVSPSDKSSRTLNGVTFTGEIAGSIQAANINGFLTQ
ncbi:MAG TPA: DUF3383 family protein [Kofleriaceae bacterium]|jgi:hypothetical protein